jgi:hypothetical protein
VVIYDDGSSPPVNPIRNDRVPVTLLRREDAGYDIRRVVRNWNECLAAAARLGIINATDFLMISGDDCIYPVNYAEELISRMVAHKVAVASGSRGISSPPDRWKPPEGAGRMISHNLLGVLDFNFPERYGYESWLIYEALRRGFPTAHYSDLKYEHLGTFGASSHRFVEWGHMGHTLGYDPVFFLLRWGKNLFTGEIPRLSVLKIVLQYLKDFIVTPQDSFYKHFDIEFREYVARIQRRRLRAVLTGRASMTPGQD